LSLLTKLAIGIVRMVLRIRRFILPLTVVSAAIALMIMKDLTVESIILNVLKLKFIIEADNLLGAFFVPAPYKALVEKVWIRVKEDRSTYVTPRIYSRVVAIFSYLMMIIGVLFMDHFLGSGSGCDDLDTVIAFIYYFAAPLAVILVLFVIDPFVNEKENSKWQDSMVELIRNITALLFSVVLCVSQSLIFISNEYMRVKPLQVASILAYILFVLNIFISYYVHDTTDGNGTVMVFDTLYLILVTSLFVLGFVFMPDLVSN